MGILWQNRIYTMVLPYIYGFNRRLGLRISPAVCVVSLVFTVYASAAGGNEVTSGIAHHSSASERVVCVGRRAVVRKNDAFKHT